MSDSNLKFNQWQIRGKGNFESALKKSSVLGRDIAGRKKIMETMKPEFENSKRPSNARILGKVKRELGSEMTKKVRTALSIKRSQELTKEQIKQNVTASRLSLNETANKRAQRGMSRSEHVEETEQKKPDRADSAQPAANTGANDNNPPAVNTPPAMYI